MPPTLIVFVGILLLCLVLPALGGDEASGDPVEQALASPQATGLLVTRVVDGTQAAEAGLLAGDVLTTYGGQTVGSIDALKAAMQAVAAETVDVLVVRRDGSEKTFSLKPGPMGVQLAPVEKGKGVEPLPPATKVAFDFSSLAQAPHDDWYAFTMNGERIGFEHGVSRLEDGKLVMRREVAFDGGEQWGVNHFDVTVVVTATAPPKLVSLRFENPIHGYVGRGVPAESADGGAVVRYTHNGEGEDTTTEYAMPADIARWQQVHSAHGEAHVPSAVSPAHPSVQSPNGEVDSTTSATPGRTARRNSKHAPTDAGFETGVFGDLRGEPWYPLRRRRRAATGRHAGRVFDTGWKHPLLLITVSRDRLGNFATGRSG